jgi:hypothetical protein
MIHPKQRARLYRTSRAPRAVGLCSIKILTIFSRKFVIFTCSALYNQIMTEAVLREKRQQILALAEKYGARNVRIFGSVARGEARPDSDIDFLVELEPGRTLFDLGGLLYELQSLLGVEVDVVTEKGLSARMRERVLREAIPL